MPAANLKEQKEAFVTGHTGTNPIEIFVICCSAPIGIFLYLQLVSIVQKRYEKQAAAISTGMYKIILEGLLILLPMTICQTCWFYPWGIAILVGEILLSFLLLMWRRFQIITSNSVEIMNKSKEEKATTEKGIPRLEYLTSYRSIISFLTYIAILAVDFHIFPRKYAKTEIYGYGLMDLGAASFVISGGFVSKYARTAMKSSSPSKRITTAKVLLQQIRKTTPLIIMGFVRLASNKGLEYQEHVSEYGVHWNFFFTLTVVTIGSSLWRRESCTGGRNSSNNKVWIMKKKLIAPIVIVIIYQLLLDHYGLQNYIEEGSRKCPEYLHHQRCITRSLLGDKIYLHLCHIFAANREGVLGCIGYLSLYILSEDIAKVCIWSSYNNSQNDNKRIGAKLLIASIVLWFINALLEYIMNISASRRSTNVTFICWALAQNVTVLFLTWLAFFLSEEPEDREEKEREKINHDGDTKRDSEESSALLPLLSSPLIFAASNRHGLTVFIIANLLTGIVNLSINTLEVSDGWAIIVILAYLLCVGSVALCLDWLGGVSSIVANIVKPKMQKEKIQ